MKYLITTLLAGFTSVILAQNPVSNFSSNTTSGCGSIVVSFTNLSTNATSYSWNFGNGVNSTLTNPVITYANPGIYTVTLTATNATGSDIETKTNYITVFGIPNTEFTANVFEGCPPLNVQFTNQSTQGVTPSQPITTYEWDFGDGSPLNSSTNPSHIYTASGTYNVSLEATDGNGCVKKIVKAAYIEVYPEPVGSFSSPNRFSCQAPHTVNFNNNSTGGATYLWYFGDGTTSTQQTPSHTYSSTGYYTVSMVVTNSFGCKDSVVLTNYVQIGVFDANFTPSQFTLCQGQTIGFSPASFYQTYSWNFGDPGSGALNTSSIFNPNHQFNTSGTFTVTLIATNSGGCTDTVTHTITVNPRPTIDFTANDTTGCSAPFTVNFTSTVSPNPGQTFIWNFGDGFSVSAVNPSHTYQSTGVYTVSLTVFDVNGCSASFTQPAYIQIGDLVPLFQADVYEGCKELVVNFTDLSSSLFGVTQWSWNFGDGTPVVTGTGTPSHTFVNVGVYTVTLTVSDAAGCVDTYSVQITVGDHTIPNFTADPLVVCHNSEVQFTDLSSLNTNEWQWDFGGNGSSTLQHPTHSFTDTGYFYVQLISLFNGCPDTLFIDNFIYVLPPKPLFTIADAINCSYPALVQFTDLSYSPESWFWDFGDGSISTQQNPSHTYLNPGYYTVKLVVTNDEFGQFCIDSTTNVVSISELNAGFSENTNKICQNQGVQFTDSSFSNSTIVHYYWDFGDGNTLNSNGFLPNSPIVIGTNGGLTTGIYQSPFHTYLNDGTYDITLIITNSLGCKDTIVMTDDIIVRKLPQAGFSASPLTGCLPLEVTFTDASIAYSPATITNWSWNFGNGLTAVGNNSPVIDYTQAGTYSVSLTVTDSEGCSHSVTLPNYINPTQPVAQFSTQITTNTAFTHCYNHTVNFINSSSGNGISYLWDFGDGNTSTSVNPSHSYDVDSTELFIVTLTVTDINGCQSTIQHTIAISRPVVEFSGNPTGSDCPPLFSQFTNASSPDVTFWSWNFGDPLTGPDNNTATDPNPAHTFPYSGSYDVTLIASNNLGCRDTLVLENYINIGGPSAIFDFFPKSGCAPLAVEFFATDTARVVTYQWVYGDGATDITTSPESSYIYGGGDWLPALLITDDQGCTVTIISDSLVRVTEGIPDFSISNPFLCSPGSVSFTDLSSGNAVIDSWLWDFGNGNTSTLQNPINAYTTPGVYEVSLTISLNGCQYTHLDTVEIFSPPALQFIDTHLATCSPVMVEFTVIDSTVIFSVDSWNWDFGNGETDNSQNPIAYYYSAGTYPVTLLVEFGSGGVVCPFTYSGSVTINTLTPITAAYSMDTNITHASVAVLFTDNSSPNPVAWHWDFGDGSTSDLQNPIHAYSAPGIYDVMLVAYNSAGCSDTIIYQITVIGGFVVPNVFSPNGDGVNDDFHFPGYGLTTFHISIFNRWGTELFQSDAATFRWDGTNNGKQVSEGTYYYVVAAKDIAENEYKFNGVVTLLRD